VRRTRWSESALCRDPRDLEAIDLLDLDGVEEFAPPDLASSLERLLLLPLDADGLKAAWPGPQPTAVKSPFKAPSFARVIDVPGSTLGETLQAWWRDTAIGGKVGVGHSLVLFEPRRRGQHWEFDGRFRVVMPGRWLTIELQVWPMHDLWTRLTLHSRSRVRPSWLYFRVGNRAIDAFAAGVTPFVRGQVVRMDTAAVPGAP
jgi:hypothetical protein